MEADNLTARKKAILLTGGAVKVPADFRAPFPMSRSTAGPGAGSISMVICFEGTRVKKGISYEKGDFELVPAGNMYSILKDGEVLVEEAELQPTLHHAPEQAFFNLHTECIYSCKFCTSPRLDSRIAKSLDAEKIVRMVLRAMESGDLQGVALTSAVVTSPQATVDQLAEIITKIRAALPDMPIGVEPYVDRKEQIDQLKQAGADEIKLNIETFDRDIFAKVCGEQDFDGILSSIDYAAKVFGRGKVMSNIIFGMGETDENVLEGVRTLAAMGCLAVLRPLRLNDINRAAMEQALGIQPPADPDRLLRLAKAHKEILQEHRLDARDLNTMCQKCGCCDIVPFRDI